MRLFDSLLHSHAGVRSNGDLNRALRVHLSLDTLSVLEERVQPTASPVDLGAAGDFAVLGLRRTSIDNDNSVIAGDVGVSQRGSLRNQRDASIVGDVEVVNRSQYSGRGAVGSVTVNAAHLSQADNDALEASLVAGALEATQTFRRMDRATTLTGNGGLNVVLVRGDITASLVLRGSADDLFIINVRGDLRLRLRESVTLDGVTADHVIFNFTSRNSNVSAGVGVINGTILAPRGRVDLHGTTLNGEVIAGDSIDFHRNTQVNQVAFGGDDNGPPPPPPTQGASLSLLAWQDANFNGTFDQGEGLSGKVFVLSNDLTGDAPPVTEGADGTYVFNNVGAGTYSLFADGFNGGIITAGSTGGNVTLPFDGSITNIVLHDGDQGTGYSFQFFAE